MFSWSSDANLGFHNIRQIVFVEMRLSEDVHCVPMHNLSLSIAPSE
jgi:hypothetical protein